MPLSVINGTLLANGDRLATCSDAFECGDSLDITTSGIVDASCGTCERYNDTVTIITSYAYSSSICGYQLRDVCFGAGFLYRYSDWCYNSGHLLGSSLFVFFGRTADENYHAFLIIAKGLEGVYERWLVWHKESATPIPYDTSFSSSEIMYPCINFTNPYGYCDISNATATIAIL